MFFKITILCELCSEWNAQQVENFRVLYLAKKNGRICLKFLWRFNFIHPNVVYDFQPFWTIFGRAIACEKIQQQKCKYNDIPT